MIVAVTEGLVEVEADTDEDSVFDVVTLAVLVVDSVAVIERVPETDPVLLVVGVMDGVRVRLGSGGS